MQIIGFRSEPAGLFLDVEQLVGAFSLSRETGEVTLRPEVANRPQGGSVPETIPVERVVEIEVASGENGQLEVKCSSRDEDGSVRSISLGMTDQAQVARAWVEDVKTIVSLRSRRARLNPTVDLKSVRAVPSLTPTPLPDDGTTATRDGDLASPPLPPSDPVLLPPESAS